MKLIISHCQWIFTLYLNESGNSLELFKTKKLFKTNFNIQWPSLTSITAEARFGLVFLIIYEGKNTFIIHSHPKWLPKKWIPDLTNTDRPYNPWRRTGKKPTGDNTICHLYQGLWFHSQREDGTKPTSIRHTKRDHRSNNDSL